MLKFTINNSTREYRMRKQQVTYTSPLDALIAVSKRLSLHENQQGMNSETFINRYRKGQLPDDADIIEWANDYQHYLALNQQVEETIQLQKTPEKP